MKHLRLSLRACFAAIAVMAAACAAFGYFCKLHWQGNIRELEAIEAGQLDIYGYETENVLPQWIAGRLPVDAASCFERITEIDLQFNDLSVCDPSDVRNLHACEWVHTLRVPNASLSHEMFGAVATFPRLKKLYVRNWFDEDDAGTIDLRRAKIPGVLIVVTD